MYIYTPLDIPLAWYYISECFDTIIFISLFSSLNLKLSKNDFSRVHCSLPNTPTPSDLTSTQSSICPCVHISPPVDQPSCLSIHPWVIKEVLESRWATSEHRLNQPPNPLPLKGINVVPLRARPPLIWPWFRLVSWSINKRNMALLHAMHRPHIHICLLLSSRTEPITLTRYLPNVIFHFGVW